MLPNINVSVNCSNEIAASVSCSRFPLHVTLIRGGPEGCRDPNGQELEWPHTPVSICYPGIIVDSAFLSQKCPGLNDKLY